MQIFWATLYLLHSSYNVYTLSGSLSAVVFVWYRVQLFDYIAGCIAGFVHEHHLAAKSLPLGFTFSFPCRQEGLAVGRLEMWSKGFKCSGVVGEDVVSLLHDAIKRRSVCVYMNVKLICILLYIIFSTILKLVFIFLLLWFFNEEYSDIAVSLIL